MKKLWLLVFWLVTWDVTIKFTIYCPDAPEGDPYNRVQIGQICTKDQVQGFRKEFSTEADARAFVTNAPKDGTLSNFKVFQVCPIQ